MTPVIDNLLLSAFSFGFFHKVSSYEGRQVIILPTLPLPAKCLTNGRGDTRYVVSTSSTTTVNKIWKTAMFKVNIAVFPHIHRKMQSPKNATELLYYRDIILFHVCCASFVICYSQTNIINPWISECVNSTSKVM